MARRSDIRLKLALVGLAYAIPTSALLWAIGYNWPAIPRFLAGFVGVWLAQYGGVALLRRRSSSEHSTPADYLTLGRMTIGALLAGMLTMGLRDRASPLGWYAWLSALIGATLFDWLDGPLARRLGATRLGGALDIEADSWLTLWCAVAAIAWGGLPWWVVIAPVIRYIHPIRALARGDLPRGGDPWWGLLTGVAQMILLLSALAPITGHLRDSLLWLASIPISAGQTLTMLAQLFIRRKPRDMVYLKEDGARHSAGS